MQPKNFFLNFRFTIGFGRKWKKRFRSITRVFAQKIHSRDLSSVLKVAGVSLLCPKNRSWVKNRVVSEKNQVVSEKNRVVSEKNGSWVKKNGSWVKKTGREWDFHSSPGHEWFLVVSLKPRAWVNLCSNCVGLHPIFAQIQISSSVTFLIVNHLDFCQVGKWLLLQIIGYCRETQTGPRQVLGTSEQWYLWLG